MATRSIVTSQPDVACDVCGRRLLRGELPDVFLAGGQRRTVCELCAPRAAHEGWLREAEQAHMLSLSPARPRRGRSPLARWRRPREPGLEPISAPVEESVTPAEDELDDQLGEVVVDSGPSSSLSDPVLDASPVFAGAEIEPAADVQEEIAEEDEPDEIDPIEEGSWRDAWMFVAE